MKFEKLTFAVSVALFQCFGIAILIMVGVWMGHYRGGFAWDGSGKEFNYHPICMIISMIFLNSQAMISYRVFSEDDKRRVKLLHMFIQMTAFGFGVVGLKAVFDFHNHNNIPNMYSLHSWIGIAVIVLFTLQLVCGFFGFLFPKLPDGPRAVYLKIHVFFGTAIFLLAIATCLTGITEKALFSIGKTYKNLPREGVLINLIAVALVIHGGLAYFIITNPKYKRVATRDEQQILLETSTDEAHENE